LKRGNLKENRTITIIFLILIVILILIHSIAIFYQNLIRLIAILKTRFALLTRSDFLY